MPFNFEIEGDWGVHSKPYDKPQAKQPKLDDSGPALEPYDPLSDIAPATVQPAPDDVRVRQMEALVQELYRKVKALEERLGLGKDG